MDENLYPRSTEYYQPNEEEDKRVEEAKQAEINAIKQDMNKLQKVLDRWDERIAFYKSTDAIPEEIITDKEKLAIYISANKRIVEILREERSFLESVIDQAA
nr:MAG TPA: hypothetical protein [Caudoviricetes sp.]